MNGSALQASQQTVLVVDDSELSREILRKKLEFWGVTDIRMAQDGRDGLAVLDALARTPDFLICDIFMPDMDGIEFIGALAKRGFKGALILITGGDHAMLEVAQDIATMKGLRMLGAVTKPAHQKQLGQLMGFSAV